MNRKNRKYHLAAAMTAFVGVPLVGFAAPVTIDQTLLDQEFQLNGTDYTNSASVDVNASEVQNDPLGVNEQEGTGNLQENRSEFAPSAETKLRQNLTGQDFNTDPAGLSNPQMYNAIDLNISSTDPIIADVGVNAAAGAFNLQINASIIALGGDLLSQSTGDLGQGTLQNAAIAQDVVNDVMSNIVVDEVVANVGVNAVAGIGNAQINSFTATSPF